MTWWLGTEIGWTEAAAIDVGSLLPPGQDPSGGAVEAITADDGPLGIIAGPGCGKTTVLAARIAFLIRERGIDPSSILAVSFTTEAARALRAQVGRRLGSTASDVSIHTLQALGRRVIDTWAPRLGFDDRPAVLHYDEGRALLDATATDLGWDTATFSVAELAAAVDRCRLLADDEARCNDPAWPLAQPFEDRMRRHGAIDFVAMLCLPLRLFREHPEVCDCCSSATSASSPTRPRTWILFSGRCLSYWPQSTVTWSSSGTQSRRCSVGGAPTFAGCWALASGIQTARW